MFCSLCGRRLRDGAVCEWCAVKQTPSKLNAIYAPKSVRWGKIIPICCFLVAGSLLLILAMSFSSDSTSGAPSKSDSGTYASAPIAVAPSTVKPKTRAELRKEAADRANEAANKAAQDEFLRLTFAKTFEDHLLDSGLDADVDTIGKHHTILRVKYVLASKVMVYQLQKNNELPFDDMRNIGFKKFILTDGYDNEWT